MMSEEELIELNEPYRLSEHTPNLLTSTPAPIIQSDAFFTRRNPIGEITTLISSLYTSEQEEESDGDASNTADDSLNLSQK